MPVSYDGSTPIPKTPEEILALTNQALNAAHQPTITSFGGATSAADQPSVYFGTHPAVSTAPNPLGGQYDTPRMGEQDDVKTQSQAIYYIQDLYFNNRAEYDRIAAKMVAAGMLTPAQALDFGAVNQRWGQIVGYAQDAYYGSGGTARVSPFDFLDQKIAPGAGQGPTTSTQDTTAVNYASRSQVQGANRSVTQDRLGRAATDKEGEMAYSAVHSAQAADPNKSHSVSVTTPDSKGNTATKTNTTSTGGADVQEVLTQQAEAAPDYAEFQAATTYFAAAMQILGAANGAGA